jgi:hypothetical protein
MLYKRNAASWHAGDQRLGQKLLGDLPVNDVARILIRHGTNEVNLVKKDDLWRVRERNDYPAGFSAISDFLLKLRDLKIGQIEPVGPSQLARLELATGQGTNSAMLVEFRGKDDKTIQSLLLGKKHVKKTAQPSPQGEPGGEGWPDGRYVMVGSGSQNAILISDPLTSIEPKADQWLNKDFFKIEKARSVAVAFPNATNSWKLTRETESGDWKLDDLKTGEALDSSKASGVSNPFSSPSFTDVVALDAKPDQTGMDKPTAVTVATFDNFTYAVKVGGKTNDNYHLAMSLTAALPKERTPGKDEKAEDKDKLDKEFKEQQKKLEEKLAQEKTFEKWIYLVSSWTVDSLLKERAQLMVEKKEEPKPEEKPASGADATKPAFEPEAK